MSFQVMLQQLTTGFSDTAFLTAPGYGGVFWKSESL